MDQQYIEMKDKVDEMIERLMGFMKATQEEEKETYKDINLDALQERKRRGIVIAN